jgi:hypothetical protein
MKMNLSDAERERRRQHRARITTREVHVAGGRAAGRIAADSGRLAKLATPETCSKAGLIGGQKTAESGKLSGVGLGIKTPESLAKGGRATCHLRWHVNRNRPNPSCDFCLEENLIIAFA